MWRTLPLALAVSLAAACAPRTPGDTDTRMAHRSIEDVQNAHTDSLMKVPGVVGTMIGACDSRPCIKVLVERSTPELRRTIPDSLEGYRVAIEETGIIRPQDSARR